MAGADRVESQRELNRFLAGVERRALVMAEIATRNREDALDIVQDAMLAFASHYAHSPVETWPPLFYRTLQNRIRDWTRRQAVRRRWRVWLDAGSDEGDRLQELPDPRVRPPDQQIENVDDVDRLLRCLERLAPRQREAVLLRQWEGMDVRDTATAMKCSAGSVKTHLSRGLHALRQCLGGSDE